MKLTTFFLLTHGAAAATVAAVTAALGQTADPVKLSIVAELTVMAAGLAARRAARFVRESLTLLEAVVADHERSERVRSGLTEFDQVLQTLGKCAQRWETAAATNRRQKRELQVMIGLLGGSPTREPMSWHLRDLLGELGSLLHSHHSTIEHAAAEIAQYGEAVATANESQRATLTTAANHALQLFTAVDALHQITVSAADAGQQSNELAAAALVQLREVIAGLDNALAELQRDEQTTVSSEGLQRRSSDLTVRLEEIHERAHLLGLNAALQSIHVRERVTGSPTIAGEAGALAVELREAASAVASLLDMAEHAPAQTMGVSKSWQERITQEMGRATNLAQTLKNLCQALDEHLLCILPMSEALSHQRQLAQELRSALEQCSEVTQTQHHIAASMCDTLQSLTTQMPLLDQRIDRLRNCGSGAASSADTAAHETPTLALNGCTVSPLEANPWVAGGAA